MPLSFDWALVGGQEIIVFTEPSVYSLKLKLTVQPPTDATLRYTKTMWGSILFSPDYSDVLFVCPDGTEIPAHRVVLGSNSYSQAYFSGPWAEQHQHGRWETQVSSDVVKAMLSLICTGEAPWNSPMRSCSNCWELYTNLSFTTIFFASAKQNARIENISRANVKDLLLSAERLEATFLFDACFDYVCANFAVICSDRAFARGVLMDFDEGQLWREILSRSS